MNLSEFEIAEYRENKEEAKLMEKEQLEKKFYCNLKSIDLSKNTWNQLQSIPDIEKQTKPVYPECVNFFASSEFEVVDLSFPDAIVDVKTKHKHYQVLQRCFENPFGQVKIHTLNLNRCFIN